MKILFFFLALSASAAPIVYLDPVLYCTGQSMEPLYHSGQRLTVRPIAYRDIRPNMIIAYRRVDGRIYVHMVIGILRRGLLMKGLNNGRADDELATEQNIVGLVADKS